MRTEVAKDSERITEDEIHRALANSGYLVEARVAQVLRALGLGVASNQAYPDPITKTSREYDIRAGTSLPLATSVYRQCFLEMVLECINNPQPLLFITTPSDLDPVVVRDFHYTPVVRMASPDQFGHRETSEFRLPSELGMQTFHHFAYARVATQFCTFHRKQRGDRRGEWMAWHDESDTGTLRTLVDVIEYLKVEATPDWRTLDEGRASFSVLYPILVVGGEMLEVRAEDSDVTLHATEHQRFRTSSVRDGVRRFYGIDVITESALPSLLEVLEAEFKSIVSRFQVVYNQPAER